MKSLKFNINSLFLTMGVFLLFSCSEKVEVPEIIEFSVDNPTAKVKDVVSFNIEHTGTYAVVWSGEPGSDYDEYQQQIANPPDSEKNEVRNYEKGRIVSGSVLKVKYTVPGTFKVILIATNSGYLADPIERVQASLEITITE